MADKIGPKLFHFAVPQTNWYSQYSLLILSDLFSLQVFCNNCSSILIENCSHLSVLDGLALKWSWMEPHSPQLLKPQPLCFAFSLMAGCLNRPKKSFNLTNKISLPLLPFRLPLPDCQKEPVSGCSKNRSKHWRQPATAFFQQFESSQFLATNSEIGERMPR